MTVISAFWESCGPPEIVQPVIELAQASLADIRMCFLRPEMKFSGIGALIARIKTDAGLASKQLDATEFQNLKADPFLSC